MRFYNIFPLLEFKSVYDVKYDYNIVDHSDVCECKMLDTRYVKQFRFDVEASELPWPDFIGSPLSWPLCSGRLYDSIESLLIHQAEFLDVELWHGEHQKIYKLINILNKVDCLDLDKSDIEHVEETDYSYGYLEVKDPVLKKEKIPDETNIFRLVEDPVFYFVSENLIEIIMRQEFVGIDFKEVEVV